MAPSPPWSDLPHDILKTLVAYLLPNFFDVLNFEAVCKSWRAAAAALRGKETVPRRPRGPTLPCMTFQRDHVEPAPPGGPGGGDAAAAATTATTRCFYSIANDGVYSREAAGESRDWVCWGSAHGWLLMVDLCGAAFLFNPLNGGRVSLPPMTTLPGVHRVGGKIRDGAPFYVFSTHMGVFTADGFRHLFLRKLVLSSSPTDPACIAMVSFGVLYKMAYARPGGGADGDSWTELLNPWDMFEDVIYHDKERRFYALSYVAGIVAIDFPTPQTEGPLLHPTVKVVAPRAPCRDFPKREYLAILPCGKIVQVYKFVDVHYLTGDSDDDDDDEEPELERIVRSYRTCAFRVFVLKAGKGKEKKNRWVRTCSIGHCSLFLGLNQSISLPASGEAMGKFRPNCIYFTDEMRGNTRLGLDCGIFDIGKKNLEFFFPPDAPQMTPHLVWITPTH